MHKGSNAPKIYIVMQDNVDFDAYESMFRLDPEGFAALRAGSSNALVSTHQCANGDRVVCVEKRKLHSGRDPRLEAKRFVRGQALDQTDIVLLFGYGSGYVANEIDRRGVPELVCYEPSLEILSEGLFHLPCNPQVQIVTSIEALRKHIADRFRNACIVKLIPWPASTRIMGPYFETAREVTAETVKRARLDHNTHHLRSRGWLRNYLLNLPYLAKHPNLNAYKKEFGENPAIVCAAGPSLNKNAELLKSLQDKCIIIAVNTAARALAQMGIEAHVVVSVESLDITSQLLDIEWLPKATAFLELTGNPKAFELPFKHIVPIAVSSSATAFFSERLEKGQVFGAGQCVANASVAIASRLGCPGIVLIGQDLAYKDDLVYAKGTVFEEIRVTVENGQTTHHNTAAKQRIHEDSKGVLPERTVSKHDYRPTKLPAWGDPDQEVQSNEGFAAFQKWFADAAPKLVDEGLWIVNATEGGAHIPGWTEQSFQTTIEQYQLDQPPSTPEQGVRAKLERIASKAGISRDHLRQELEQERAKLLEVVRSVLSSRGWVNNDPDGDVLADKDISARIGSNYEELRELLRGCPLLQASISQPLQSMLDRQHINTFSICRMIEDEAAELNKQIEAILESLQEEETPSRAVS